RLGDVHRVTPPTPPTQHTNTNRYTPCGVYNSARLPLPAKTGGLVYTVWMPWPRVERLAKIHQPGRVGKRNRKLLDYVRALRRLRKARWNTSNAPLAFRRWWEDARHVVGTKDEAASLMEFLDAWRRCPGQPYGLDVERLLKTSAGEGLPP